MKVQNSHTQFTDLSTYTTLLEKKNEIQEHQDDYEKLTDIRLLNLRQSLAFDTKDNDIYSNSKSKWFAPHKVGVFSASQLIGDKCEKLNYHIIIESQVTIFYVILNKLFGINENTKFDYRRKTVKWLVVIKLFDLYNLLYYILYISSSTM